MSTHAIAEEFEARLRAQVDGRMAAGRVLAAAAAERDEQRRVLEEVEAKYAEAYAAATSAGWSEAELRKADLDAPNARAAKAARRPRSARSARGTAPQSATDAAASLEATEGNEPAA